ncbi:restriction endonuclease [Pontibacter harenae]|uniref:restriction endonuclease n=1 Tax=Pontibacter harenae TaxID=2894083 RepID=UPI001E41AE9E|nr:restriction endonuclease [Pontibacter harenae]MCC9167428.1 restriction endonuclease [Pontibacter harenae]
MEKRFPYGDQFSPDKITWSELIRIIEANKGDKKNLTEEIGNTYFSSSRGANKGKMAMNCVLSIKSYGLINDTGSSYSTTDIFDTIKSEANDANRYIIFAKHILANVEGLNLLKAIDAMHARGEALQLEDINYELIDAGYKISTSCTYVSTMKAWLYRAGVFSDKSSYHIDWSVVNSLLGLDKHLIDELYKLDNQQKYFLMSMLSLGAVSFTTASAIASHTRNIYKIRLTSKSLVKEVLEPLADLGLIETLKSTGGRGAKSHQVKLTPKGVNELLEPLIKQLSEVTGHTLLSLNKPFAEVVKDLSHTNTYIKGEALELLAIWLIRILDLKFTQWRKRDKETGGAEVDVLAASDKIVYNRWQIQCKNTVSPVSVEVVAKEIGLTFLTKADVVMVVTTSNFTRDAHQYAEEVLNHSRYYLILLDGKDIKLIEKDNTAIIEILNQKAKAVFARKELSRS